MNKAELQDLVNKKVNELEIEKELKKSMELIAEVYSYPLDEYIIIPQF